MAEKHARGEWGSQVEFLLACVGYAVGLGNVWRFPYLAYDNGGCAFLIPYVLSLFMAGLPIFYLELCIGQFSSLGPNQVFGKLVPYLQGVGWAMITVSFLVSIYYNMIIAWVLYYFVLSFRGTMLWSSCDNGWNTPDCDSNLDTARCAEQLIGNDSAASQKLVIYFNRTCYAYSATVNETKYAYYQDHDRRGPAEEFWENYILEKTDGMEDFGGLNWRLVAALFVAWIVIVLCLIKGVQSTGKVVYFTATFPYVILVILLIRGLTLPGMYDGIRFYILEPDWSKLGHSKVWLAAATQIFYSLGVGFGGLLTMASYNKFSNNCFRDAVFVAVTNCCTSIFAGFAIFSIMGFMANEQDVEVKDVVQSGTGLAFIAYPEAISRMPWPFVWAVLFFFMLFTLGLDSQFAMVETITTAVMDEMPKLRERKGLIVGLASLAMFILGLPLCTRAGIFWFNVFNDWSGSISLIVIAICEFLALHIYGLGNFFADIRMMLGGQKHMVGKLLGPTGWYFRITWIVVAPIFLVAVFIASMIAQAQYKMEYGSTRNKYYYPWWANLIGWLMVVVSVLWIPGFIIYRLVRNRQKGRTLLDGFKTRSSWCPASERDNKKFEMTATPKSPYTVSNGKPATDVVHPENTSYANNAYAATNGDYSAKL